MKRLINPLVRAFVPVGLLIALGGFSILTVAQDSDEDLAAALAAIQSSPPTPASELPESGTFQSAQHPFDWPPFPGNVHDLPAWPLGDGLFLLDDADFDYEALALLMAAAGFPFGGPLMSSRSYTSNELWLEIHGVTNGCTGWTADLTIHTPEGDTNSSYDLLYSPTLDSPTDWQFLMRCPSNVIAQTNVFARYLCEERGFFILTQTNGDVTVMTNVTAQYMAELLVPPWVAVTNATYTGATVARGTFTNGNGCGLPIEHGVILSSGSLSNAIGPNDDSGGYATDSALGTPGDTNLAQVVGGGPTTNAASLEFDVFSTNSLVLQFHYVFASEEYPEWIGQYNDPVAIFVSTNRVGTQRLINTNNDIALVPCSTDLLVGIGSINGGCVSDANGNPVSPTNALYYVDNHDPGYSAAAPYAVSTPVFNLQFDGMTVLLVAQAEVSANVTNHVKIAIADYAGEANDDEHYDSAIFLRTWSLSRCQ